MPIALTDEMRDHIGSSLEDGHPVVAASAGADQQPIITFYGSAQVLNETQLAVWVQNSEAGFVKRVAENPLVTLLYRNPEKRLGWQFHGTAHAETNQAIRDTVYDNSPEAERSHDPERGGIAVVIDVLRVIHRGQVIMSRDE